MTVKVIETIKKEKQDNGRPQIHRNEKEDMRHRRRYGTLLLVTISAIIDGDTAVQPKTRRSC